MLDAVCSLLKRRARIVTLGWRIRRLNRRLNGARVDAEFFDDWGMPNQLAEARDRIAVLSLAVRNAEMEHARLLERQAAGQREQA